MALVAGRGSMAASTCGALGCQAPMRRPMPCQPASVASTSQHECIQTYGLRTRCSRRRMAPILRSSAAFDATPADDNDSQEQFNYVPFPRINERDPYRLLGLPKDASSDEISGARNYLYEQYRWHEPSRDAIDLAFDKIIQTTLKARLQEGFKAAKTGRRGELQDAGERRTLWKQIAEFFDPTVTVKTLINEGSIFLALALWALFSGDQSFPLLGAFAYSVYAFNTKRTKNDPEANAVVGAILSTVCSLALACVVAAIITQPLAGLVTNMRQVSGFTVIAIVGIFNIWLK